MALHKKPPQPPPLFDDTGDSIRSKIKGTISNSKGLTDQIVKDIKQQDATFDNVLLPQELQGNEDSLKTDILMFYQAVSDSQELRDASTEAQKLAKDYSVEASMREDMFQLVKAVYEKKEKLDPESAKLLDESYKDYIKMGLNLPHGPKRDRFKEIKLKLGNLETDFERNLAEEKGGVYFTPEELKGVPKDVTSSWEEGTWDNEGKLKMNFAYPNFFPTVKYASNAKTRETAYIENTNKLMKNKPIFQEVIALRDEAARILGYPNHATMRIENKMAKTPKRVNDFLGDLRVKLQKGGQSE